MNPATSLELALTTTGTAVDDFDSRGQAEKMEGLYADIVRAVAIYREAAERHSTASRMLANDKLNLKGVRRVQYKVGDPVVLHIVPTQRGEWKIKHKLQWRQATVVRKISDTIYEVEEFNTGKRFQRSVALLAPDNSQRSVPAKARKTVPVDPDLLEPEVGKLYAVVDEPGSNMIYVAKLEEVREELFKFHYYGTQGGALAKAAYSPVFVEEGTGKTILHKPKHWEKVKPWTGLLERQCIVCPVKLTKSRRLTATSLKQLGDVEHYSFSLEIIEIN